MRRISLVLTTLATLWLFSGCTMATHAPLATRYSSQSDPASPVGQYRQRYLSEHPTLPSRITSAIAARQVVQGMDEDQVMASWGPPVSCNRTLGGDTGRTVCLYREREESFAYGLKTRHTTYRSVLFEEGLAVDWQTH